MTLLKREEWVRGRLVIDGLEELTERK